MITSKQRSFLRSLCNPIEPIFHIGKDGINDNLLKQIDEALEAREIIKVTVLENSGLGAREASDEVCRKLNAEGVQAIGNKFCIYKKSKKKPKIELAD